MTNSSRGVKILILSKEGIKEKIFYERRDYEAVADALQSKTSYGKMFQILSPVAKG